MYMLHTHTHNPQYRGKKKEKTNKQTVVFGHCWKPNAAGKKKEK